MRRAQVGMIILAIVPVIATGCGNSAAPEIQKLQGDWQAVAINENGKTLADDVVRGRNMRIRFDGSAVTMMWGGPIKGTFSIDPNSQPKALDITMPNPSRDISQLMGIYEWEGERLRVCFTYDTNMRPGEFRVVPPTRGMVVLFERAKPE